MTSATKDHFARAEQLLRWGHAAIADMTHQGSRGNLDEVERHFYSLLALVASLHDVLKAKAKKGAWRDALDELRSADPLLRYLWLARNSEHHDALLKWGKETFEFNYRVVDESKYRMVVVGFRETCPYHWKTDQLKLLLTHVFNASSMEDVAKLGTSAMPLAERILSAGIEIESFAHTLDLLPFKDRHQGLIDAPTMHLGKPNAPSAISTGNEALKFYSQKLDELKSLCAS